MAVDKISMAINYRKNLRPSFYSVCQGLVQKYFCRTALGSFDATN